MTRTRTKIICTLGPAVGSHEKILELIDAGMNVARINFSHGTHAQHQKTIEMVKAARKERKVPLAIMLDTKGPEIRIGKIAGGEAPLVKGQKLLMVREEVEGNSERFQVTPGVALNPLKVGTKILFDDGYITATVAEVRKEGVVVLIENSGVIKSQKGVNIPGVNVDLPAMTEQDVRDIIFGCEQDVDVIAASFIRSAEHVLEIKRLLKEKNKSDIVVIAKIENSLGVQNFDSIIQVADGIMVARGDLGVELPLKEVPRLQKMMIRKCYSAGKPVITATQMLESMIKNPRPTRAEVSDVANAIYDSSSAVMLSGETAVGLYPIETVSMMRSIIEEAEKDFNYRTFFHNNSRTDYNDVSTSVSLASVKTAYSAMAKAIFVFTMSGFTARVISKFRPQMPIIAMTSNQKVYNQMALNWGVIPVDPSEAKDSREAFSLVSSFAMKKGLVHYGDLVVVTAGAPFGVSGTTNMMLVESIGDVLVRGYSHPGKKVHGKVLLLHSPEDHKGNIAKGKIVVLGGCEPSYQAFLQGALGIVLQNHPDDLQSERKAIEIAAHLNIPVIVRADGAMNLLTDGELITLDPVKGIIYRGSVSSEEV